MKTISGVLMAFILLDSLALFAFQVSAQAPGVIVKIDSDTTWLSADSHVLTGPLLVNQGITLTVDAGSSVNLNGYEMRIDGTLLVKGTSSDPVFFTNGTINYSEGSSAWKEDTNTGCVIENAVFDAVNVDSAVALSITNSKIDRQVYIVGESLLWGNEINWISLTGSSIQITNNDIGAIFLYDCSLDVFENTINVLEINGNSFEIFENAINTRIQGSVDSVQIYDNDIGAIGYYKRNLSGTSIIHLHANVATITHNEIEGEVCLSGDSLIVTNNNITGYTDFYEWRLLWGYEKTYYQTPGIILKSGGYVSENRIVNCSIGIEGGTTVEGNFILNSTDGIGGGHNNPIIQNNTITAANKGAYTGIWASSNSGTTTIENNFIGDGFFVGVSINSKAVIRSNTISNNELGIGYYGKESAIIEKNLMENNNVGIRISSPNLFVTNNTLNNSGTALIIENITDVTFTYNNIQNSSQHSIYLEKTSANINATNNWWGTTDNEEIGIKIYDSKYSFDLGTVTFNPLLKEQNPEAKPNEYSKNPISNIPEFTSTIIISSFLVGTFAVLANRKKRLKRT